MKINAFNSASIILAVGLSGAANAASLVQNGSFEATTQANGTWSTYSSLPGPWIGGGAGIELRNNVEGKAYSGDGGVNFVELDTSTNSSMWQFIQTTANQVYELTFFYSPRVNRPIASDNAVNVFWNDVLVGATNPTVQGAGTNENVWKPLKFWVEGTGNLDMLKFTAAGNPNSFGGNIDAVALSAVPLPGAALLFGTALLTGAAARRKKQKQLAAGNALAA